MGAISEIFTADPSEWDITEEDTQGSPENDQDFTDGGRLILRDGVSPSGRRRAEENTFRPEAQDPAIEELKKKGAAFWCAKCEVPLSEKHYNKCEAARQAVKDEGSGKQPEPWKQPEAKPLPVDNAIKMPPAEPAKQYNGTAKLDLTNPDDPIIWGELANLMEIVKKYFKTEFRDGWTHILPKDVTGFRQLCEVAGYNCVDQPVPAKKSPPKQEVKPQAKTTPTTTADRSADRANANPVEPVVVSGTIERLNMGMAGKSAVKMITLALPGGKKLMVGCFHKSMWDELEKGLGKFASFRVETKGSYTNIAKLGLIKIGSKEWDEQGMPAIQRKDQEAGQRTLY
jgi:hypothetical protein